MSSTAQPGDYFVVRAGGLGGALIRLGTRSQVAHAGIVISPATPGGLLRTVEATPSGARIGLLGAWPDAIFNDLEPLDDSLRGRVETEALKLVGTPYSWLDIAALSLACLGVRWAWLAKRVERTDRLICSQLADLAYCRAGRNLFTDGRLPQDVTPGDLLMRTAQHPWTEESTWPHPSSNPSSRG